jgi:diacylglycerol kinase family enzyme
MEPAGPKSAWQEKVKDTLGDLGIAGETVFPSPARTIEELASLGIIKGYSTIVAVGSEKIVNKIVTALINQKADKNTVLGVIPDDYSSKIAQRIGVRDYKEACQALKFRKLQTVDVCHIEPNKYFMTEATVESGKTIEAYIGLDNLQASASFNKITIKPGLKIEIDDLSAERKNSMKSFISSIFGKKIEIKDIYSSIFHGQQIQIETPRSPLALKVDGETVMKTPFLCHHRAKALKIVVARDIID